jgi:Fe2+ transport system protein FeoA
MDNLMANTGNDVNKGVKNPPRSPKSGALLKPFNSVTAKEAQAASVRAHNIRKAVRAKLLEMAVNDGKIDEVYLKALKSKDKDALEVVEKAMKIVGLLHDQSEEAVSRVKVDATTDNTTAVSGKIEFVLPTADK